MLNFCWSNTKRFLSVLVVFGKYFVFTKIAKISKTVLPCSGDSVAGWSSRIPQSRAHSEIFRSLLVDQCPSHEKYLKYFSKFGFLCFLRLKLATCSQVEVPVAKGTQRFSQLTSRLPHKKNFQSWKTLRKFFKTFVLSVLATCLRLNLVVKIACFVQIS